MRGKKKWFFFAIVIIVFSFILRVYSPLSDLPKDISISGSIYTDEGNQCHNSRSRILYGKWFPDNWKITNYNPVVPYLKYLIFKIFGVGLLQVRSVSFIFALLTLFVFYLTLRSGLSPPVAAAGILLLGFNFLFTMYNRIGTFETPMIFWMVLSIYFIEKFRKSGKIIYPVLSGVTAFMAFVFKMTAAHIIPVPLLAMLSIYFLFPADSKVKRGTILKGILYTVAGIFAVFIFWLFIFYLPNREWIKSAPGSYIGNQMFPKSLSQMFGNILAYNWKEQFFKMSPVWVASLLYIPIFVRRFFNKRITLTEAAYFFFLLSHTASLMIMNHRPTRYLIAAIPPMVYLTSLFLERIYKKSSGGKTPVPMKSGVAILITDILWLNFFLFYCLSPLFQKLTGHGFFDRFNLKNFVITIIAVLLFHFILGLYRKKSEFFRIPFLNLKKLIIPGFIVLSLSFNLTWYFKWLEDRTNYVETISNDIASKIDGGSIAGLTAPVAVLESRNRALFLYPDFVHWEKNSLDKYSITHVLAATFNFEVVNFFNMWPEKMSNSRLLNIYNVKDQFLLLYSIEYPYIYSFEPAGKSSLKLNIINPKKNEITAEISLIIFNRKEPSEGKINEKKLDVELKLKPGKNIVNVPISPDLSMRDKKGYLLHIINRDWPKNYRLESENFPAKSGSDLRNNLFSSKYGRYFNYRKNRPGFMISSNNGKFIPFGEGLITATFRIKINRIKSRIRPLAILDIYDNSEGIQSVKKVIKMKNAGNGDFKDFKLVFPLSSLKNLEFRIRATGYADIIADFIDICYYQGKFL